MTLRLTSTRSYTVVRSLIGKGKSLSVLPHTLPLSATETPKRFFSFSVPKRQEDVPQTYVQDFANISSKPFSKEAVDVLQNAIDENDVEIKPDGILYLPEIKYRRILNKAFGPGGWALMPRGPYQQHGDNLVTQEYALYCQGQFVAQAHGEQNYGIGQKSIATALEGAKSNALMRCCKDIGIASELWDPNYIIQWREKYAIGVWCENVKTSQKKLLYRRKDRPPLSYPYKEIGDEAAVKAETPAKKTAKKVITPEGTFDKEEIEENMPVDQPDMFEGNILGEEDDAEPAETPAPAKKTKGSASKLKFGLKEKIPFGKFKGQTWEDAMKDKSFHQYCAYLVSQGSGQYAEVAREALAYLNKRA